MRECYFEYADKNSEDMNLVLCVVGSAEESFLSGAEYELSTDSLSYVSEQLLYGKKYEKTLEFDVEIINLDRAIGVEEMREIKRWLFGQGGWKTFKCLDPEYSDYHLKCMFIPKEDIVDASGYRGIRCTLYNNSPYWYEKNKIVRKYFNDTDMWNGGADNEYPIYRDFWFDVQSDGDDIVLPTIRIYSPNGWQNKFKMLAIKNEAERDWDTICSLNVDIQRTVINKTSQIKLPVTIAATSVEETTADISGLSVFFTDENGKKDVTSVAIGAGDYCEITVGVNGLAEGETFTTEYRMKSGSAFYFSEIIQDGSFFTFKTQLQPHSTGAEFNVTFDITTSTGRTASNIFQFKIRPQSTKLSLNATEIFLQVGETFDLNSFNEEEGAYAYHRAYSSQNESIATVTTAHGLVTAVSVGATTIRCTMANGKYAECTVNVIDVSGTLTVDCKYLQAWFTPELKEEKVSVPLSPNGEAPIYFTRNRQLFGIGMSNEFWNLLKDSGAYIEVEYTPMVLLGGF